MKEDGLIDGCKLLFQSTSTDGRDYHTEMNARVFEHFLQSDLLPSLTAPSCIVMDNATYHSRVDPATATPTSSSKKQDMIDWLLNKGINFDPLALKPDLYKLIKIHRPPKEYIADKIIQQWGHSVLRLPPYHCELNPIEMIWGITKNEVARNNETFNLSDIKVLVNNALDSIPSVTFAKSFRHTQSVETEYWSKDGLEITPIVEDVIIDIEETDTESDFSDESDFEHFY